jgi:predicted aldo/keto reductase-like oxidoreductase
VEKIVFGKTGLEVSRVSFGALPIQRVSMDTAKKLLQKAYKNGINFFDTARLYTDSEEKIGNALSSVRKEIIIATKTHAKDADTFWEHLETSLNNLKTDYIDIYQFHNPDSLPVNEDELYGAMLEAKNNGYIRHIGITSHSIEIAREAVQSGLYETIQYPFNYLSTNEEINLSLLCKDNNIGFIAMKALSGGLITNAEAAFSFIWNYPHVVPIWGIQRETELDRFIDLEKNPPPIDEEMKNLIEKDKKELSGNFCRGCGYCLPCPADIPIPMAARMKFMLRRAPYEDFITNEWKENMERIENCIECGHCLNNCPYHLNTPELLREMLADYRTFVMNNED